MKKLLTYSLVGLTAMAFPSCDKAKDAADATKEGAEKAMDATKEAAANVSDSVKEAISGPTVRGIANNVGDLMSEIPEVLMNISDQESLDKAQADLGEIVSKLEEEADTLATLDQPSPAERAEISAELEDSIMKDFNADMEKATAHLATLEGDLGPKAQGVLMGFVGKMMAANQTFETYFSDDEVEEAIEEVEEAAE